MRFATTDTARTVWALGGCQSWYLDQHGEATTAVEVDVHRQSEAGYMPAEQELLVGDIAPQADKI